MRGGAKLDELHRQDKRRGGAAAARLAHRLGGLREASARSAILRPGGQRQQARRVQGVEAFPREGAVAVNPCRVRRQVVDETRIAGEKH